MPAGVTNFPASLDSTTNLPDATGKNQNDGSGDTNAIHSNLHDTADSGLIAVETKLGIGSSVPTNIGDVLQVTAAGATAYSAAPAGTPAATVAANSTYARSSAVGLGTKYARDDHDHGMPGPVKEAIFPFAAVTSPTTGTYRYRVKAPSTLLSVRAELGTVAAAGLDAIFDVRVNGATRISTGKPQIIVGQAINTNAQTFTSTALSTNDLITVNIDQGSDGFQATVIVELQENSTVGAPAVGIDLSWGPTDQGFLGWTLDPAGELASATILTAGTVYIGAISVRRPITVTNVWCAVGTAGVTLTASQNFMGLYNSAGTRLAVTADMTTDFGSTGVKSKALTVAQAVGPGIYYVAVVSNGTTPPTLARGVTNLANLSALHNQANLTASTARFASNATVQTSLPASLTMASNVTTGQVNFWYAIS